MTTNNIDRSSPPFAEGIPAFSFPDYFVEQLSNGIKVLIIQDNSQPLVNIKLSLGLGASSEKKPGLAYIAAQLITKGSGNMTASEIASETDIIGSSLTSSATWDDTSINLMTLSDYLNKSLSIMADCYLNAVFSEDETERLKKRHIANIRQENSDPSYLAQISFELAYFDSHPYGHPLYGTTDSINDITRQECIEWYDMLKTNSNPFFIVGGNVDKIEILGLLEKHFVKGGINQTSGNIDNGNTALPEIKKSRIIIIDKADASQATLKLGIPTIQRKHPDFPLLQLSNTIFGGYFLSRLNALLREKLGYTYGIYSMVQSRKLSSVLMIGANVNRNAAADSIKRIKSEMAKIKSEPVSEDELNRAKQYILGSFVRSVETPRQVSSLLYSIEQNHLSGNYFNYFFSAIAEASVEELFKVQQKYFNPETITISLSGNAEFLVNEFKDFENLNSYANLKEMMEALRK